MKRLVLLCGLLLLIVTAARAGVGPGVASELFITPPLMGGGQAVPGLALPSANLAPNPAYAPAPIYPAPAPPNVVSPFPGASPQAPVAVTVGPMVHPEHGVRGWLRRHHLWR